MNRFVKPLNSPTNFKPFELPATQMINTLAHAEKQQDDVTQGLYEVLDYEFPYIDIDPNEEAYNYIKQDIESGVDKTLEGNTGDLRGLKGNVLNLQRNIKSRATKSNGDIYKLSSDYARYDAWKKENADLAKTEPLRYKMHEKIYLNELEKEGGSLKSNFKGQPIVATPDWAKFVKDYTADIKADTISRAQKYNSGVNIVTYEEARKYVSDQDVMEIAAGYLQGTPGVISFLQQESGLGILKPEQLEFINTETVKDANGKESYVRKLNPLNPAASSIRSAMIAQGFLDYTYKTGSTIDAGLLKIYKDEEDKKQAQTISFGISPVESIDQVQKTLNEAIESGDAMAIKQLMQNPGIRSSLVPITDAIKADPNFDRDYEFFINKSIGTDDKKQVVSKDDFALLLATKGGGSFTDHKKVLKGLGYSYEEDNILVKGLRAIAPPAIEATPYSRSYFSANEKFRSEQEGQYQDVVGIRYPNDTQYKAWEDTHLKNNGAGLFLPSQQSLSKFIASETKDGESPKIVQINVNPENSISGKTQLIAVLQYPDGRTVPMNVSESTGFSQIGNIVDKYNSFSARTRAQGQGEPYVDLGTLKNMYPDIPSSFATNPQNNSVYINNFRGTGVKLIYKTDPNSKVTYIVPEYKGKVYDNYAVPKDRDNVIQQMHTFLTNNKLIK